MTKIYRDIKDEKDIPEAQKLFKNYHERLEHWVYEELLNQSARRDNMDDKEAWHEKAMRQDMWGAVMSLSGLDLFPEDNGYDYKTDTFNYTKDLNALLQNRKKVIANYQAKFRKGFESIEQFFTWRDEEDTQNKEVGGDYTRLKTEPSFDNPTEQINVKSVALIIHNDGRDLDNDHAEKSLRAYINDVIPKAMAILKKRGFSKLASKITLHYRFTHGANPDASADYDRANDDINIYPWGNRTNENEAIGVLLHEIGHQYYYKHLSKKVIELWDSTITKKIVRVTDNKIDEYAKKYLLNPKIYNELLKFKGIKRQKYILSKERDPSNMAVFSYLADRHGRKEPTDAVDFLHRVTPGIQTLPEYVSDYGATKATETFPEVFRLYLTKPRRVGDWTRHFFKSIVAYGGVKLREEEEIMSFKQCIQNKLYH